jgi:ATP-binding cassette, subfamily B, bacterial
MKLNYFFKTFLFIWNYGRKWMISMLFIQIITGLLPFLSVWLTSQLVNEVSLFLTNKDAGTNKIMIILIFQLLIIIIESSAMNVSNLLNTEVEQKLEYILGEKIALKASQVPILYFDNHQFHNHLERIYHNKGNRLMSPVLLVLNALRNIVTLTTILLFLINISWMIALLTTISSIPILLVQGFFGNKHYNLLKYQTPSARKAMYLSALLNDRDSASEIRIFNLKEYLISNWSKLFNKNREEIVSLSRRKESSYIGLNTINALLFTGSVYLLVQLLKVGSVSIGGFVSSMQAIRQTQATINDLAMNVAKIYSEQLFIQDFFEFLEFKDSNIKEYKGICEFPRKLTKGIEFRNVSFKYPYSKTEALQDVSFTVNAGERVAIIGENGSGKSTLVKCLMGLYPVSSGDIIFDNLSLKDIRSEDINSNITTIFQDFIRYNFTLKENIVLNRVIDDETFLELVRKTGVEQIGNKYKDSYDTVLGKMFIEGEDLSGGQWQKVALARALHKEGQVFILDEPTSSLDPMAELSVFNQFDELTKDKTTFFISHRLAAARLADKILVLKGGKLVEIGSHDELISKNDSEYSRMYQMQAKWYLREEVTYV